MVFRDISFVRLMGRPAFRINYKFVARVSNSASQSFGVRVEVTPGCENERAFRSRVPREHRKQEILHIPNFLILRFVILL